MPATYDAKRLASGVQSSQAMTSRMSIPGPENACPLGSDPELSLTPAGWLQADIYSSFEPSSFRLREFNSSVTLHDGNAWSLRFASNFLRPIPDDWTTCDDETLEGYLQEGQPVASPGRLITFDSEDPPDSSDGDGLDAFAEAS